VLLKGENRGGGTEVPDEGIMLEQKNIKKRKKKKTTISVEHEIALKGLF